MSKYSVDFWGSDPDENNDDCWTGRDFDNLAEAQEFFDNPFTDPDFARRNKNCTAVIVLTGPDVELKRDNPDFKPSTDDDDWQREIAHQAGMMGGCDAYNDAMGY